MMRVKSEEEERAVGRGFRLYCCGGRVEGDEDSSHSCFGGFSGVSGYLQSWKGRGMVLSCQKLSGTSTKLGRTDSEDQMCDHLQTE